MKKSKLPNAIKTKRQSHERDKLHIPLVHKLKSLSFDLGKGCPEHNLFTIHHSPNENVGGRGWQSKLFAMSTSYGEPDLRLDFAGGRSLYIELKWEKAKIETGGNQDIRLSRLTAYGNTCYVLNANCPQEAFKICATIIKDFAEKKPLQEFLATASEQNRFGEIVKLYAFGRLWK